MQHSNQAAIIARGGFKTCSRLKIFVCKAFNPQYRQSVPGFRPASIRCVFGPVERFETISDLSLIFFHHHFFLSLFFPVGIDDILKDRHGGGSSLPGRRYDLLVSPFDITG